MSPPHRREPISESELALVRQCLRSGRCTPGEIASAADITSHMASRAVAILRERGLSIRSLRGSEGWCYEVVSDEGDASPASGR